MSEEVTTPGPVVESGDLAVGAIAGIVVAVVMLLVIVLAVGVLVCRLVYRTEHGKTGRKRLTQMPADEQRKRQLRSATSASSLSSGDTDFFVKKNQFDNLLAGMQSPWNKEKVSYDDYDMVNGAAVYSNPAFDEDRGRTYESAVIIQSWYRGCRARRLQLLQAKHKDNPSPLTGGLLHKLTVYTVKTFGLMPTGGHRSTSNADLHKCLERIQKSRSKRKEKDQQGRVIRLSVSPKGLKVIDLDEWLIRHSVPLKDVYSFVVSPFNDKVFGCIFRRRGITYCLAVLCEDEDASLLFKTVQDANLSSTLRRLDSKSNFNRRPSQRRESSTSAYSNSGDSMLGLGSPWLSASNMPGFPNRASMLSELSMASGFDEADSGPHVRAAIMIQSCYRAHRAREEVKEMKRLSATQSGSQTTEFLSTLLLHPALLCSMAPIAYEGVGDKETLTTALQHITTDNAHREVIIGVSSKGLTLLSHELNMIVHVVPVRQVRTFMVSPHDPTIFALLFRSKAGSICLAVKCREALTLYKSLQEAQLVSTLQQLEHVKSNMPEEGASRRLLDSASSFTGSRPVSGIMSEELTASLAAPLPESVTVTLRVESSTGGGGSMAAIQSKTHQRTLTPSDSLTDSVASMTAESFAAAAHSLLDSTLKETAQYVAAEMSRSPSKEMRNHMDEIITDSTLKLLEQVDSSQQHSDVGDDDVVVEDDYASNGLEGGEDDVGSGSNHDMASTNPEHADSNGTSAVTEESVSGAAGTGDINTTIRALLDLS